MRIRLRLTITVIFVFSSFALMGEDDVPGREISLPEAEVKDHFIAFMLGLITQDKHFSYSSQQLAELFPEYGESENAPFHLIKLFSRGPIQEPTVNDHLSSEIDPLVSSGPSRQFASFGAEDSSSRGGSADQEGFTIVFFEGLAYPLPFDILGYHPGAIYTSSIVKMRETYYPSLTIRKGTKLETVLQPVWIIEVFQGFAFIDFDKWLDSLLGRILDDLRIRTLVLFRFEGTWYALLAGLGHNDRIISGMYDLKKNKIVISGPRQLRDLAEVFLE